MTDHVQDMVTEISDKIISEVFDSPEAAIARAEEEPPEVNKNSQSSRSADDFYGDTDFPSAMRKARYGWKEGREHMNDAARDITENYVQAPHNAFDLDVAGAYPVAALAAAGDPACMVTPVPELTKPQKIVRILVNASYSHTINENEVNNWGGAIVSWVDAIEARQSRVELWITYPSNASPRFDPFIKLKRPDDPMEIDRLAFWLAHPSSLRRVMFALMEKHEALSRYVGGGYGTVSEASKKTRDRFDCYIPAPPYDRHQCKTRKGAFKWVSEKMNHVINDRQLTDENED